MKRNKYVRIITVALLLIIVLYTNFNIIKDYDIEYREDKAIVKVDFKQPMKKIIEDKIEVTTDLENVIYAVDWEGKILQIHVPNPKGVSNQNINVKIKGAKSKIPLIKKKLDITFRSKIDYVIDIYKLQPKINEVGVELYPKILIETTYPIKEIYINGLEGNFTIDDNKAELTLLEILKPNTNVGSCSLTLWSVSLIPPLFWLRRMNIQTTT